MMGLVRVTVLLAAGTVAGCASTMYEGRLAWEDGWRKGAVTELGEGVAMTERMTEACRPPATTSTTAQRYATIKYRRDRRYSWRTVAIPPDARLAIGDVVYVNAGDCMVPIEIAQK